MSCLIPVLRAICNVKLIIFIFSSRSELYFSLLDFIHIKIKLLIHSWITWITFTDELDQGYTDVLVIFPV